MEMNPDATKLKLDLAIAATAKGRILLSADEGKIEFNRGCDHVCALLDGAFTLFQAGYFPTCIFIAISAIEETAKLEIAVFRREGTTDPTTKRSDDLLFNHKAKHSIALQEVIAIGSRLPAAIGEDRARSLLDMATSGELVQMRENSLYSDLVDGKFTTPSERFHKVIAREILLLAIEVWDDRLVGLTNHTYSLRSRTDDIFEKVKNAL